MDRLPNTCADCGHQFGGDRPRNEQRGLLTVIDELGSSRVCSHCAMRILVLADKGSLGVTVFVSHPGVRTA